MQCACTSMVLTRLPLTTTSRRPCACAWPEPPPAPALAPALISQPTKARRGPVFMVPLIGIAVPLVLMTVVKRAIGHPPPLTQECDHLIQDRDKVHPVSSPLRAW